MSRQYLPGLCSKQDIGFRTIGAATRAKASAGKPNLTVMTRGWMSPCVSVLTPRYLGIRGVVEGIEESRQPNNNCEMRLHQKAIGLVGWQRHSFELDSILVSSPSGRSNTFGYVQLTNLSMPFTPDSELDLLFDPALVPKSTFDALAERGLHVSVDAD